MLKSRSFSIYVVYAWLVMFCLLPLILMLLVSFLSTDSQHLVSLSFTISHYTGLLTPECLKVFFRSTLIAILTTLGCLILAYPFSYFLVKSKHQSLLILLIIIPFWTSSLVRTYALMAIFKAKGVINSLLLSLHVINSPLPMLYSNFAVLIGLIYNLFPFMVLPIFSNMERFDFRLIEAAKDLGASRLTLFFRVFLPNTAHGVMAGSLLVLLPAMTLFYIPNVLGGARSLLLGNLIQDEFLVLNNWPQGSATSIALMALLLILLFVFRRKRGLYAEQ